MRKATATYHAPEGDAKSATMNGVIFNDGESVELNSNDHGHMINKLQGNPHFEIDVSEDDGQPAGAGNRRDLKAGLEEARDHDFEADRRAKLEGKPVAELREMAEQRGIDHEGMSKSELREALST